MSFSRSVNDFEQRHYPVIWLNSKDLTLNFLELSKIFDHKKIIF